MLLRVRSEMLVVRTSVIEEIRLGQLDPLYYLKTLKIEANHKLYNIQEGIFRNLTHLRVLSISYNSNLESIQPHVFDGLKNLRELTFVNNGFSNIKMITVALKPSILPALEHLDVSENGFDYIAEDAFSYMTGTVVEKLDLKLCRIDYIHPNSFLPFKRLTQLSIGQNDLNASLISEFIVRLNKAGINLDSIDLSGMGFRRVPPRHLMEIIANTTIRKLILADNQFEIISNDAFPRMNNIQMVDLRRVSALCLGSQAFSSTIFPNLRILMLGGNNLPGIHIKNVSDDQIVILDLSYNKGTAMSPMYYDIDKEAFTQSRELRVLNLSYNRIKSIFEYTFRGLNNLRILNLENGTVYFIGPGTFKSLMHLEILNLANNPLTATANLTSSMFVGLNELKVLILKNCGIKHFHDDDNIFRMMPNLTRLVLSNNQLYFITPKTLEPLRSLKVLDLSENLLVSWWEPLFLASGIRPVKLYLANNKISQFTLSMVQDIDYLLNYKGNFTVDIQLLDNVFVCDCISMYKSFLWLQTNGSERLRKFFYHSEFLCSSPDVWEDRRVADFLSSIKRLRCLMYEKITSIMVLMWTAPTIISVMVVALLIITAYKYRIYVKYWLFLARIAIGRKFFQGLSGAKQEALQGMSYKYDAFVSYCNEDRDFVSEMVSQLEHKPPYFKLCVYERDFEIGSFISESILASINSSKYIILIVSRNFAKSQWCRWETQLAEYHRLFMEDGTAYDPLLLIRLDDVDAKQLNTTLKFLLKTKIYLSWNEQEAEEFWKKLRNLLIKNR
ncbi:toll-like receptor 4 isoform X3 [Aricia agestis]|uniref:toll-like receptor 4 isoform X3 n=1 Tax=Aricia agestis TaxID=91739 RepID=UPI001C203F8E|nr:toll-like receptor 4 isoform X3 [Aricia agestis]